MRPYRRPTLHPSYGCLAILATGPKVRCGRPHCAESSCIFDWDPIKGVGIAGPDVTLCRMHDYLWSLEPGDRIEVVGGWLGRVRNVDADCYTVLEAVFEHQTGDAYSNHWWSLRRETRFGDCTRMTYDQAIANVDRLARKPVE